ncbi:efflux RND transporter periplasmic adaptor subunit [Aerophototrophica crusticola]|uniref:Efflux RND transporter periplasmic adaptor subunit n=1 Tax=Aerophototrophica crusticola TaxID=1709002 RepID=A0A858R8Y3_9PROT|nr:efflux RND transporter periplasmic adaptor subunit [Rhodospirillaceae bacterium B3]
MSIQPVEPLQRVQPKTAPFPGSVQAPPRRGGSAKWVVGGVALVALAGAGVLLLKPSGTPAPQAAAPAVAQAGLTVTVAPVQEREIQRTLLVTGSLAAWDELPIGSQVSGLAIVEVLADEGDAVKAGQLLARFDDSVLKADLAQKEASLREAEAVAGEAAANVRRAEELSRTGAVSARELDARRATAATAQARVGVAQANRDQAVARLRQTEVRAPTDGTVTRRNARLGAVMAAGGTELFRMIREDRVELVAEVPELDLFGLAVGQKVTLGVDGAEGQAVVGTVRLIAPTVDPKTRMGIIKVDLEKSGALKPGMFVTGRVEVGRTKALVVPDAAVVYKDAKPLVFVRGEGDTVQMRNVETGGRDGQLIAITRGVAAGESVVVAGAGYLKDGDAVTVADKMPDVPVKPLPVQK